MRKATGAERNILADLIAAGGGMDRDEIVKGGLGHRRVLENLEAQGWVTSGAKLVTITEAGGNAL